jgi:N-acetylmuramoyl-L-alanine amidase
MMRKLVVTAATVVCCLLILGAAASLPQTAAAQAAATVTILAERLNVRSGPGTTYEVVASAKSGEKYSVTGQSGNCAWLRIASGGKALGWVSGNKAFVTLKGACSSIPAAGAAAGGAPAPAGKTKQGCALLLNQLKLQVKLSVKRSDGWQTAWSIPAGAQAKVCVDPGAYTATFTAAGMPGNMAFPVTVQGGEYFEIPLTLPGR